MTRKKRRTGHRPGTRRQKHADPVRPASGTDAVQAMRASANNGSSLCAAWNMLHEPDEDVDGDPPTPPSAHLPNWWAANLEEPPQ